MSKETLKSKAGKCPNCGSNNIDYGTLEPSSGDHVYYNFTCKDCKKTGKEFHKLIDGEAIMEV